MGGGGSSWGAVISHHREETSGCRSGKRSSITLHKTFQLKHWGSGLRDAIGRWVHLQYTSRLPLLETCQLLCLSSASWRRRITTCLYQSARNRAQFEGYFTSWRRKWIYYIKGKIWDVIKFMLKAPGAWPVAGGNSPRNVQALFKRWKTSTSALQSRANLYICLSAGQEIGDRQMSSKKKKKKYIERVWM